MGAASGYVAILRHTWAPVTMGIMLVSMRSSRVYGSLFREF